MENCKVASSLTAENSKDMFRPNVNQTSGKCTAWTDEKHNLYLDQLEASFVNKLRQSRGLLSWCSEQNICDQNSSRKLPVNFSIASEQFTILPDGCRQKINLENNHMLDTAADSNVVKRPWIRHFGYAGKSGIIASGDQQAYSAHHSGGMYSRGKRTFSRRLAASLEQIPVSYLCQYDSVGSITEVSDQNFVDEDHEEKSSSLSMGKRLRTAVADTSSHDQIVSSGKFHMSEISNVSKKSSSDKEEKAAS